MKSVCIVGAGPAGLAGAKVLLQTKAFRVTVYEKADRIGGIWALDRHSTDGWLDPDTPINLSKFAVAFSDLDWNSVDLEDVPASNIQNGTAPRAKAPMFPKAWQANKYLETYKAKNIPDGVIRLSHEVIKAERLEGDHKQGWRINTRDDQYNESSADFDYLLLGSGFFSNPRPIAFNVPECFLKDIRAIHSSRFRRLEDLFPRPHDASGKTILILGGGISAGEAATKVAQQLSDSQYSPDTSRQQGFKGCKVVHVAARPFYALPPFVPSDAQARSFIPVDFGLYDLSRRPAGPIVGNAGRVPQVVKDMIHAIWSQKIGSNQSDLGVPALEIPRDEPRSAIYVALTEGYAEFARSGLIQVIGGRVVRLDDRDGSVANAVVECADQEEQLQLENVGAVIYATGYSPASAIEFLAEDVKHELHYDPEHLRLPLILQGWQTTTAKIPELALLGFYEGPYWPIIEMQATYTAQRWHSESSPHVASYEETEKLLDLRKGMLDKDLDVPQFWFGDYAGYMEEMASHLQLQRNNGPFEEDRKGSVSPARYLSMSTDKMAAASIMQDLHQTWQGCLDDGRYVPRAVFRALQGNWTMRRTIDSALSSFPSGTLEGEASFHFRLPTQDPSGLTFDLEYLYIESGVLTLSNGATMTTRRRYVYRYSEQRDQLSVWFVKPDNDLAVDYLFHNLKFVKPSAAVEQGACIAEAEHLCVEDMYNTEYRLPLSGISLHEFQTSHRVKGPSKDYVATTNYSRPSKS